ncbi:MAG: type II secretion system GspH family protein [Candidatus Omnitrophica bacterium]|nr:type II secretion system GspH family protein [Candidatus Omnitrophota bacterium]
MRNKINNKGFTLLETMLVVGVLAFMAAAMLPATIKMINLNQAKNVAKEITGIQEAERSYYINQMNANNGAGSWADSIQQLQQGGYIPSTWNGQNVFGNSYSLTDNGSTLTVSTSLPSDLQGVIQADCIDVSTNGQSISSTIPVPAAEPALAGLVHRYGNGDSRTATQSIGTTGTLYVGVTPGSTVDQMPVEKINNDTIPDLYDPALQTQGISPNGWLSQAKFPANIDPMMVRITGSATIYLPADFAINSLYAYGPNGGGSIYMDYYFTQVSSDMPQMQEWTSNIQGAWAGYFEVYCNGQYNGKNISFTAYEDELPWQGQLPLQWFFAGNCDVLSANGNGSVPPTISGSDVYLGSGSVQMNQGGYWIIDSTIITAIN